MSVRTLPVLLHIIGADNDFPVSPHDERIADAYRAEAISLPEVRLLQSFGRRSPKGQKRALADAVDVTPEGIAEMKAKLQAVQAAHRAVHPDRGWDDVS